MYFQINRSRLYFSGSEGRLSIHNLSQDMNGNADHDSHMHTQLHPGHTQSNFMHDNSLVVMSAEAHEDIHSDCKQDKLKESQNHNS